MTGEATTATHATGPADPYKVHRGWEDIAAVLEVSDDTVQRYAARPFDPLPVFYDHAERPCLRQDAAVAWVDRQALFYHSFHALRTAKRLPSQRQKEPRPVLRRRVKAARDAG